MSILANAAIGRLALYVVKISIALVLLYWLYYQGAIDVDALQRFKLDAWSITMSAAAVGLVTVALLLLSIRLVLLLQLQGINLSFRRSIGLTMIGAFFGSVLPGLIAGDAVKVVYLLRGAEGGKSKAVAAVIFDRIIGVYALFLLGAIASGAAWAGGWLHHDATKLLLIAPSLTLLISIFLIILMVLIYNDSTLTHRLISKLPSIAQNLFFALAEYAKHGRRLFQAVVISALSHAMMVLVFFVMAALIQDVLTLGQHLALDPLAMVLNVVPLTPGGLGITEGAFAYLFHQVGSPNGVIISLMGRAVQYVVFSVGGVIALMAIRIDIKSSPVEGSG